MDEQVPNPASDDGPRKRSTWLLPVVVALICAGWVLVAPAPTTTTQTTTQTATQRSEGPVKTDLLLQMLNASNSATLRGLGPDNAVMFAGMVCGAETPTRDGRAALLMGSSALGPTDAYAFVDAAVSAYC